MQILIRSLSALNVPLTWLYWGWRARGNCPSVSYSPWLRHRFQIRFYHCSCSISIACFSCQICAPCYLHCAHRHNQNFRCRGCTHSRGIILKFDVLTEVSFFCILYCIYDVVTLHIVQFPANMNSHEHKLTITFPICPSVCACVCRLSSVCVREPYSADWNFRPCCYATWHCGCLLSSR